VFLTVSALFVRATWQRRGAENKHNMAPVTCAINLSDAPLDVVSWATWNSSSATCALVCSDWAKAAAATTHSIVKHRVRDLKGLQHWLEKNGSQIETMQLRVYCKVGMARLPCAQLQDLLLRGYWDCKLILDSRVWGDIAAATKLTSVSLQWVSTDSQQADVVSALTALPDLQQLDWGDVECKQKEKLSDSRLLQHLTTLTGLDLSYVSAEALQHLGCVSKLQRLHLSAPTEWAAASCHGLQQLIVLTRLDLHYNPLAVRCFPTNISHLTALQQLKVPKASLTELNGLKALTALTGLCVTYLRPDPTPLQLPDLHSLDIGVGYLDVDNVLSCCTQLCHSMMLGLAGLCLAGPDSLAASSMLERLYVCHCSLSSPEGPAGVDPWQLVFPGPGRLPHLTLLVLPSVSPAPQQADLERLVACCSGLRRLELTAARTPWSLTSASAFECLLHLSNLVKLRLSTVTDEQCSSLAQLTGLQDLQVDNPKEVSPVGLWHLVRLQQLTSLYFWGAFNSSKVSTVLQAQLSDSSLDRSPACAREQGEGLPWQRLRLDLTVTICETLGCCVGVGCGPQPYAH